MAARLPGGSDGPGRRRAAPRVPDGELWRAAMRDVRPLRRRKAKPEDVPEAAPAAEPLPAEAAETAPAHPARPGAAVPPRGPVALPALRDYCAPGLDRRSSERLRRGRYPIEARLDLHGMTQDEAHRALTGFIARSARAELRCVLVITGKGLRGFADAPPGAAARDDYGVLRQAVPRWLNEAPTREAVLAFGAAQPRDGGSGALYILLRRRR
jgi:DNA-nicking Smr family endonuclease